MPEIVCITGKSGSGKTTLIERLIPEFKRHRIKVAVLKHTPHGINLVEKRKDSERFITAGAEEVILITPKNLVHFKPYKDEIPPNEAVLDFEKDVDLVLVEGYKSSALFQKIEVKAPSQITPRYVQEITNSIEDKLRSKKVSSYKRDNQPQLNIWINGKRIGLKGFVRDIISASLLGMASTLKGVKKVRTIHLKLTTPSK